MFRGAGLQLHTSKEPDSITKRIRVLVVIVSLKDFCRKADGAVKQIGTES